MTETNRTNKAIHITRYQGRWTLFAPDKRSLRIARMAYTIVFAVGLGPLFLLYLAGGDIGFIEISIRVLAYTFLSWLLLYIGSFLFFSKNRVVFGNDQHYNE
ncbi:MAG: hypothetical protein F4X56_09820 [Gammaproteobacteria bacterium]|nr:hypothetical protein [Gammaproteobacteria bacterium]